MSEVEDFIKIYSQADTIECIVNGDYIKAKVTDCHLWNNTKGRMILKCPGEKAPYHLDCDEFGKLTWDQWNWDVKDLKILRKKKKAI